MMIFNVLNVFLLWILYLIDGTSEQIVTQPEAFQTVKLGESVDIKCKISSLMKSRAWYKLSTNRILKKFVTEDHVVSSSDDLHTLTIPVASWEDVGTYYCGTLFGKDVDFGSGTVLMIEGEPRPLRTVLQNPESVRVQPGDSVTLSCSVTSSRCPQNHTGFIWVRSGSGSSQVVSRSLENAVTCEKGDGGDELTCVHNLSLTAAEDGTYLCVVNVCGDMWTGSGTRVELNEDLMSPVEMALVVVSTAYAVTVFVLLGIIWKINKRKTKETDPHHHGAPQHSKAENDVIYARVKANPRSSPRQSPKARTNNPDAVIYARVKDRPME